MFLFFAPDFLDSIILTKNKKILNISGKEGEKIMANTIKKAIQEGLEVLLQIKNAVKTAKKEGNLYENVKHFFKK